MSEEAQKYLHAEESAEALVHALEKLNNETVSYKSSKNELDAVREKLVTLITSITAIAKDTHEVVKVVKSIGGPEILGQLATLRNTLNDYAHKRDEQFKQIKILLIVMSSVALITMVGVIYLLTR